MKTERKELNLRERRVPRANPRPQNNTTREPVRPAVSGKSRRVAFSNSERQVAARKKKKGHLIVKFAAVALSLLAAKFLPSMNSNEAPKDISSGKALDNTLPAPIIYDQRGRKFDPDFSEKLTKLFQMMRLHGFLCGIESGVRTEKEQKIISRHNQDLEKQNLHHKPGEPLAIIRPVAKDSAHFYRTAADIIGLDLKRRILTGARATLFYYLLHKHAEEIGLAPEIKPSRTKIRRGKSTVILIKTDREHVQLPWKTIRKRALTRYQGEDEFLTSTAVGRILRNPWQNVAKPRPKPPSL